jgi:transposase
LKVPAASTLDLDTLDTAALKALIRSQDEQLSSRAAEIERLKLLIVRLQRMQFGRKSEKLEREIRQLELQLDDLEESAAQNRQRAEHRLPEAAATVFASVTSKPARGPLPDHLPRQTEMHRPIEDKCPECGGELRTFGERMVACPSRKFGFI